MKKIIISLIFFSSFLFAKLFFNLSDAINSAKWNDKPILVFIVSSNCPHCQNLVHSIGNNKNFFRWIVKSYNWVVIDVAFKNPPASVYFDGYVPTIEVFTPNMQLISRPIKGEVPLNMLYQYLNNNLQLYYRYRSSNDY